MKLLRSLCAATLLLLNVVPAMQVYGQDTPNGPPASPILRIEAGVHTAGICQVSIDGAGRFLVSCSVDKTVRIWSLVDGSLLRTLRPPIGSGNDGKIFSAAISPDGGTVACSGWIGGNWAGGNCIDFFDRQSGELTRRITGLEDMVGPLAYSSDGKYLAGVLGGSQGLRVYSTADGSCIFEDRDYGGGCLGLDWDTSGRLVTCCWDGYVRLYSAAPAMKQIAKGRSNAELHPYTARFSPDGSKVAMGYADSAEVTIFSGDKLNVLHRADVTGSTSSFSRVCWSRSGDTLYAAGAKSGEFGQGYIRAWSDGGRGGFTDSVVSSGAIVDMRTLPFESSSDSSAGEIVYATAEPSWGVLNAKRQVRSFFGPSSSVADNRGIGSSFLVSPDGSTVQFNFMLSGKRSAVISIPARRMTNAALGSSLTESDMAAPIMISDGLDIAGWDDTRNVTLNGKPFWPDSREASRCLAIAPDRKSFLIGTDWNLRCFDADGKEMWNLPAPDTAAAVNITRNSSVATAAFADGTIRWYRMRDGKELLDFFPHADQKRWVLWTPEGYYDCSPGGEDLIGWHLNRGTDKAADFYPASRFRGTYYRPDVIQLVLSTLDNEKAVQSADEAAGRNVEVASNSRTAAQTQTAVTAALPPVVNIVSPPDFASASADSLVIRFTVRTPGDAPVTNVRALVDGRPPDGARGLDFAAMTQTAKPAANGSVVHEITVPVPSRDCEISILAENKNAVSAPAHVHIKWQQPNQVDPAIFKPKLYVLAVGVGSYVLPGHSLTFPAKDAADFSAAVKAQSGGLYRDVETRVLTNDQATKDNVLDGLEWIERQTTSRDLAMVFIAGRGDNDPDGNYYFLTHEFDGERWKRTAVSYSDIQSTLRDIKGKAIFFVDTCHSGSDDASGTRRKGGEVDMNLLVNDLTSAENGVVVFTASTGRHSAFENSAWGNGAFTKALIEGFSGKADFQHTGRVTINMLDLYVSERVKELTGGRQTPTTTKPQTVPDFPVATDR